MAVRHVRPPDDAAMTQADSFTPVLDAGRLRALVASVALAAAGYLAFSLWAGWHDVAAAVRRAGVGGVATLLGLSAANYLLRFGRWQLYLERLGTSVAWPRSMAIYLAGFALTTTPGKAGEAVRCLFLRRHGLPYTAGIAAIVSERLSDLTAIVAIACVGLAAHPALWPLVGISLGACVALSALLCAGDTLERLQARAAQSASRVARAAQRALGVARAAHACHRPGVLLPVTALALMAWACEAWAFHLLLGWLGLPAPWTFSFFVYAVGMLAGAVSFLPGGLGGTEATMVGLLAWSGMALPDAVAATVLIRVCTLWFAVLLGVAALPIVAGADRRQAGAAAGELG